MALDGTYAGLCASIADTLMRGDLTAVIPDWIDLFEAQMNRKLRTRNQIITATATVSTELAAVPGDFAGPISITLPDGTPLDSMSPEGLAEKKARWGPSSDGMPTAFSVVGGQFQFYPALTAPTVVALTYYQKIPSFSIAPNWVSQNHIDAYLYGSLVHSAPYLIDDPRTPVWASLATLAINDINGQSRKELYGAQLQTHNLLTV